MEKYAAIDIGTNSMRLLLAVAENSQLIFREKHINTTRIGHSVDAQGAITPQGIENNLRAFSDFVKQARAFGAKEIWAIATSAVRDAKNGRVFTEMALQETGITIEIIEGSHEAQLGYQGVLMGYEKKHPITIIDIGGGSTEIITGNQAAITTANSYHVGALRMTERLITTDPISAVEYNHLAAGVRELLSEIGSDQPLEEIIGIGGTATTIAAICQQLDPYDPDKVHGYGVTLEALRELQFKLRKMTLAEKRTLKGLHPKRADIILAGTTIMLVAMELLKATRLIISEYDNLEGLLYEKLKE